MPAKKKQSVTVTVTGRWICDGSSVERVREMVAKDIEDCTFRRKKDALGTSALCEYSWKPRKATIKVTVEWEE